MKSRYEQLIRHSTKMIADDYGAARDHALARDAQRAGHEAESTWVRLIDDWGPGWPIVTRRYIVGPEGETNEIDLVILKPDYPRRLLREPSVLITGVAAAFSCKLTLRPHHIREAILQKRRILDVDRRLAGSVAESLMGPFPFGLLAHHLDRKVQSLLETYDRVARGSGALEGPQDELDVIFAADSGIMTTARATWDRHSENGMVPALGGPASMLNHIAASAEDPGPPLAHFVWWLHSRLIPGGAMQGVPMSGVTTMDYWVNSKTWPDHYPDYLLDDFSQLFDREGRNHIFDA